jgi:hypothetical protein
MFLAPSFVPAKILQLETPPMHNNTIKSTTVTHDNAIILLPHCNAHVLLVDTLRPRRVKMKIHHLQEPLSRNTGNRLIKKYTTFNMQISHMQEHQPFTIFAREKPTPCKLGLDIGTRDFCQQYSATQHIVTPREREGSTPARFLTKKHQPVTIANRGKQNHGQMNNMLDPTEFQALHDSFKNISKHPNQFKDKCDVKTNANATGNNDAHTYSTISMAAPRAVSTTASGSVSMVTSTTISTTDLNEKSNFHGNFNGSFHDSSNDISMETSLTVSGTASMAISMTSSMATSMET